MCVCVCGEEEEWMCLMGDGWRIVASGLVSARVGHVLCVYVYVFAFVYEIRFILTFASFL